jgi:CHAD domain-containing protein
MSQGPDTLEREVKLEADLDFQLPEFGDLVGGVDPRPAQQLWTTYYDSEDLRLWNQGVTLRFRHDELRSGTGQWTLKLPSGTTGDVLERVELTWPGRPHPVPDEAQRLVKGVLRHRSLTSIAELESHRRRLTLRGLDGTSLVELDDDSVTVHGGAHDGLQFRKIELELGSPDDHLREVVLERLRSAGASSGHSGPKLARALRDAQRRPASTRHVTLDAHSALSDVIRASLLTAVSSLLDRDVRLRLHQGHPTADDVHKSRVAARRLRSDLKTLRALLDPVWTKHVRDDLKWLGAALGALRDCDVLREYVEASRWSGSADAEGAAILLSTLDRQRGSASQDLAEVLESDRYIRLLDKLDAAATRPPLFTPSPHRRHAPTPDGPATQYLPLLIRKAQKNLEKSIKRSDRDPADHQLHRVRIQAKQVRYAAELAEPVAGKAARRTAKAAEHVQELLGGHQDAVVAEQWLRRQVGGGSSLADFACGQLSADQMRRRQQARRHWPTARRRLRRKKTWRWTD